MTLVEFQNAPTVPANLSAPLQALWQDGRGEWEAAHHTVQDDETPAGAWVHAYLHRKEGDQSNARYWYARAGQPVFDGPLKDEWRQITESLLAR